MTQGKITFGLIGAASISTTFIDAVSRIDNAEIAAVASKSLDKAREFAEKNNIPRYYDSYAEMMKSDDIQAVYIATTHNFHYENIMLALSCGKHVLCEKAMVLTQIEAEAVFAKSRATGLFVMECMWSRFQPAFREACKWIRDGEIGEISTASCQIGFKAPDGGRVLHPDLAGGALYDIGVYAIETIHALIGRDAIDVTSRLTYPRNDGVDFTDHIILDFGDNITANILCSVYTQNVHKGLTIYGSKGILSIPDPVNAREITMTKFTGETRTFAPQKHSNGFIYEIEEAIACIQAGEIESPTIPHEDTIHCAWIFDRCKGT
jgi:Predicted dehydrogenases and related proteins